MLVERRVAHPHLVWDKVSLGVPDLRRLPGVEGVKNLAERVWETIIAKLSSTSVPQLDYTSALQQYAKSLDSHGFTPSTLVPQESGIIVSPDGKLIIHWHERVIEPTLGCYSSELPNKGFEDKEKF